MKKNFNIYELTDSNPIAETMELGDKVYSKLEPLVKECLENEEKFVIDFSNIKSLTTKFLNNAIGNLIINLDGEKLYGLMTFSGLDMAKKATLRWSLNVAYETMKLKERKLSI
ncbi:DUF4325 domain-containing protein [Clostridium botulinum]|uniref:STAS-like domain-containing protein n=1 Tax=Clostridium botulinum TaxID=1491 RepID=UPI0013F05860|nr:STAS-like domain-containing protein [Clostridium botulinum]MBY6934822.1 STAS-like domain-containing protein [Clostridium botulinum]NFL83622.1 DUF4325 domain-containing protein [Clostridium botulinum]NFN11877.1 DUF4325 domain-containing protein [Clostridium botulinum]NFO36657.1 DUF4325 domain-containing protein [Clostridium botulinum]NFO45265.1 DUF4325 domain-containing protein [Clostridium botulinum]